MIAASTTALYPLTPPWECGPDKVTPLDGATRWEGVAASVMDRQLFEAELAAPPLSGREVYSWEWADVAQRALGQLAGVGDRDEILRIITLARIGDLTAEEDKQTWFGLRNLLSEMWPEWQTLERRQERRRQLLPVLACKWFLKRKNGDPLETDRDGRLTDSALAALPAFDMMWLGNRLHGWAYGGAQLGNSAGPSPLDAAPKTSRKPAASASKTRAGKPSASRSPRTRR